MDPFIGMITVFAGSFAPRGWATCDGQLLPIQQYQALFSILGDTYGGDGKTTFALPDLRGRAPIHMGAGPGRSSRKLGSHGGTETVALTEAQMPKHSHAVQCNKNRGQANDPEGRYPADSRATTGDMNSNTANAKMAADMIEPAGSGAAHDNMPPFLTLNYIIALDGTYPSRN